MTLDEMHGECQQSANALTLVAEHVGFFHIGQFVDLLVDRRVQFGFVSRWLTWLERHEGSLIPRGGLGFFPRSRAAMRLPIWPSAISRSAM